MTTKTGFLLGVLLGVSAAAPFAARPASLIEREDGTRLYIITEEDMEMLESRWRAYEDAITKLKNRLAGGGCA